MKIQERPGTMKSTVFGDTDDATKAQLDRCLSVSGDESIGVLCADNHKGYSMPIGGWWRRRPS